MIKTYKDMSGSLLAAAITKKANINKGKWLFVTEDFSKADALAKALAVFACKNPKIHLLESEDETFTLYDAASHESAYTRLNAIKALTEEENVVIVSPITTAVKYNPPLEAFSGGSIKLIVGKEYSMNALELKLVDYGYTKVGQVFAKGQFARRGDIIDIFEPLKDHPVRIEFFDDEIETIRLFDVDSQRGKGKIDNVEIFYADPLGNRSSYIEKAEKYFKENYGEYPERLDSLLKHLRSDNWSSLEYYTKKIFNNSVCLADMVQCNLIFEEPQKLYERLENRSIKYKEKFMSYLKDNKVTEDDFENMPFTNSLSKIFKEKKCIFAGKLDHYVEADNFSLKYSRPTYCHGNKELLQSELNSYIEKGYMVNIVLPQEGIEKIKTILSNFFQKNKVGNSEFNWDDEPDNSINFIRGQLNEGFVLDKEKRVFLSGRDIFGTNYAKRRRRTNAGEVIKNFSDIKTGDYVVHEIHGVGRYSGIKQIKRDGSIKDFLQINYAGNGVLYLPVESMSLLQKYIGSAGKTPKIHSLSGTEWAKTKIKAKEAVEGMAQELLELSAKRSMLKGYAFAPDTDWQKEFELQFPYIETEDQLRATEEIKQDMENSLPMDRLLCGDVGFGKTEVAARAIFKCVSQGKQAAFLVPTTILASQHYKTLSKRYKDFPVNVKVLSRFNTKKEENLIKEELACGTVDLIIGTHKLLSDKIKYKDLGLLVVDEEQRFGVKQKEMLKQIKENVDVLTLSATPIPRTLNMSLVGLRNMSLITEPPAQRRPVETYVMEEDEDVIKEALTFEIERSGQAFVIFNRVRGINKIAARIEELVPEAKVAVAHGAMEEHRLEDIMQKFIDGVYNVLVSTAIIETGIDIPNVNTAVILNADKFGLSQLYQLRGRVGRSQKKAYTYLMYKKEKVLSEESEKRLKAIKEFTELGAGFKIAMRDLEIRGTGNLLGREQSGHIMAVGYEMYCKLVQEAVVKMKGGEVIPDADVKINLPIKAYIDEKYISDEIMRIEIYQKISLCKESEDRYMIKEEIEDRFGAMPEEVRNLIEIAYIRFMAIKLDISQIWTDQKKVFLKFKDYQEPMAVEVDPGDMLISLEGLLTTLLK